MFRLSHVVFLSVVGFVCSARSGETPLPQGSWLVARGSCPGEAARRTTNREPRTTNHESRTANHDHALPQEQCRPFDGRSVFSDGVFVCTPTSATTRAGFAWSYRPAPGRETDSFVVEAEGRTDSKDLVEGLIYVDVSYADGSHQWGLKKPFPHACANWRKRRVVVSPDRAVKSASVYFMARHGTGTFHFRKPALRTLDSGLWSLDGAIVETPLPHGVSPFFLLRDAAQGGFVPIADGGEAKGVALSVKTERRGAATFFDVTLSMRDRSGETRTTNRESRTTNHDHALSLVYAVPLAGDGPIVFHDDLRHDSRLDGKAGERFQGEPSPCGSGRLSKWPLVAASSGAAGRALALDVDAPAFFHGGVNARHRLLFLAFDVAVAPEMPAAHFRFCAFDFAPERGLRGAFEIFRETFPQSFAVRAPKQGVWMAFRNVSTVPHPEDFGFAFKEGEGETAWDDAHGLLTFRYTEPTTWWLPIGGKDGRKYATYDECLARVEALVAKGDKRALSWKASCFRDEEDRPVGYVRDTPWCNGIVWSVNSLPGIAGGDFDYKNGEPAFSARYKGDFPNGLDGEYVDSSEMYVTDALDFDRAHFAAVRTPLTWDAATCRPAIFKGLIGYEYVRTLAERVHAKGRLMMANGSPWRQCWQIPFLDVSGTETNWRTQNGWRPVDADQLLYVRALCGGKPFCFLMNTDFSRFTHQDAERFMMRALAFGMFPGFFSQSATSRKGAHYFDHPEYYENTRPLFKKYVPLCRKVNESGWRCVNRLAKADDGDLFVEQWGDKLLTVFNPDAQTKKVRLQLCDARSGETPLPQGGALRKSGKSGVVARELVDGGSVCIDAQGAAAFDLPGETVRVLEFP